MYFVETLFRADSQTGTALVCVRCCVRVIKSHRAGVGKTLKVRRLAEQLRQTAAESRHKGPLVVSIPLHCRTVDQSAVLQTLLQHTLAPEEYVPRIFHIDIAHEVTYSVLQLLCATQTMHLYINCSAQLISWYSRQGGRNK